MSGGAAAAERSSGCAIILNLILGVVSCARRQVQPVLAHLESVQRSGQLLEALISSPPLGAQFFKFGRLFELHFDDLEMAGCREEVTLNPGEGILWTEAEGLNSFSAERFPGACCKTPAEPIFDPQLDDSKRERRSLGIPGNLGSDIPLSRGAYQSYTFDDPEGDGCRIRLFSRW
jgi:hypothetical protein